MVLEPHRILFGATKKGNGGSFPKRNVMIDLVSPPLPLPSPPKKKKKNVLKVHIITLENNRSDLIFCSHREWISVENRID